MGKGVTKTLKMWGKRLSKDVDRQALDELAQVLQPQVAAAEKRAEELAGLGIRSEIQHTIDPEEMTYQIKVIPNKNDMDEYLRKAEQRQKEEVADETEIR